MRAHERRKRTRSRPLHGSAAANNGGAPNRSRNVSCSLAQGASRLSCPESTIPPPQYKAVLWSYGPYQYQRGIGATRMLLGPHQYQRCYGPSRASAYGAPECCSRALHPEIKKTGEHTLCAICTRDVCLLALHLARQRRNQMRAVALLVQSVLSRCFPALDFGVSYHN